MNETILIKPNLYKNATICSCINCLEIFKYKKNYFNIPTVYNQHEIINILKFHKKIIYINNGERITLCNNICRLHYNKLNNIITNICICNICR